MKNQAAVAKKFVIAALFLLSGIAFVNYITGDR